MTLHIRVGGGFPSALTGLGLESVFGPAMGLGMVINILVSETWIQLTRTPGNGNRHWRDYENPRH